MNVEKIKRMMSEISSAYQDSRESGQCKIPEDTLNRWFNTLNESLLKAPQMKDAEDAALWLLTRGNSTLPSTKRTSRK